MNTKTQLMPAFTMEVIGHGSANVVVDRTGKHANRSPSLNLKGFADDLSYADVLRLRNWLNDWIGHHKP